MMETKQKYFSPECEVLNIRLGRATLQATSQEIPNNSANPSWTTTPYDGGSANWWED